MNNLPEHILYNSITAYTLNTIYNSKGQELSARNILGIIVGHDVKVPRRFKEWCESNCVGLIREQIYQKIRIS